jgi:hypothetical protein
MDSSSISLAPSSLEHDWRIDVPMRSFQGGMSYDHFFFLFRTRLIFFLKVIIQI